MRTPFSLGVRVAAAAEMSTPLRPFKQARGPIDLFLIHPSRKSIKVVFGLMLMILAVPLNAAESKPNIVLIYADDLGYGDVSSYGATMVRTPNIDRLAKEALRFTDAHAAAATCTPSRYAMLTGQYAWRKAGTGVLNGDAPLIISPERTTLQSMLQEAGYTTGIVGKWHLGLGDGNLDWNAEIKPGPLETGFNYAFVIPATGDRVPCVYIENRRVFGLDPKDPIQVSIDRPIESESTDSNRLEMLRMHPSRDRYLELGSIINGIPRIGYMIGGKSALWVDEEIADVITRKATDFIEKHREEPFFLFFSLHDIHVPRVPHQRFAGTTLMGARGDVIVQADWSAGQILKTLDRLGLAENTLVVFTSDNGPVVQGWYQDEAVEKLGSHKPAGPLRGGKFSAFEGGTRVPLIVRWPARVKPGVSHALVCQIDFLASFAALTGQKLLHHDAPDSFNFLPSLLGESPSGRDHLIQQSGVLSLRRGPWRLIEPAAGPSVVANRNIESGLASEIQLYNLAEDIGETENIARRYPEKVRELQALMKKITEVDRSRP